jgi:hypothetical protein
MFLDFRILPFSPYEKINFFCILQVTEDFGTEMDSERCGSEDLDSYQKEDQKHVDPDPNH